MLIDHFLGPLSRLNGLLFRNGNVFENHSESATLQFTTGFYGQINSSHGGMRRNVPSLDSFPDAWHYLGITNNANNPSSVEVLNNICNSSCLPFECKDDPDS